jgi:hypothetical protein
VHYQPFKKHDFIVQGGIFPSHIGFESAWNTDNLTLTRSMLAENSPYYESGLSAEWISPTEKWGLKALCLSGWQQSQWKWPVQHPSWGWASYWMPSTHWKLAYNGFWGHLDNRSTETYQYHNFYLQGKWKSLEWIAGYDFGIKDKKNRWNSPVLILAKTWNERFKSAARWEKMTDPNTVILLNRDEKWTARNAVSMNLDWKINSSFTARIEFKYAWAQKESKTTHRDLITCNVIFQARWERLTMQLNNQ